MGRLSNGCVTAEALTVDQANGRSISAPLAWYPRLLHGTPEERRRRRLVGGEEGIHWPDLEEDISVANLIWASPQAKARIRFSAGLKRGRTANSNSKQPRQIER